MNTPTTTTRRQLTEAQRLELLALLADRPHLTGGQVAKIFEARTGRRLEPSSVDRTRAKGYRSMGSTHPRRHLTEVERAHLERLCHQSAPSYPRAEIARRFEATTGRSLHRTCVGRYLARHFEDCRPMGRGASEGVPGC